MKKSHSLGLTKIKNVDFRQFENIESKEIAYILGLLWADGHVTFANNKAKTPIIKHNSKPEDNFIFLDIFNKTGKWNTFTSKNIGTFSTGNNYISTNWVSSRLIGEFLIDNDYRNKTKSPDKIINKIPDDLRRFWFMGFFDGDGSVTIIKNGHHSVAFTSDKNQDWKFMINLFESININGYKIRIQSTKYGSRSQIRITNKLDIIKFDQYLYQDADDNIGLKRKKGRFRVIY